MIYIGIDPGKSGAIVSIGGNLSVTLMPIKDDGSGDIDYRVVCLELSRLGMSKQKAHVFLERAIPMAMGSKHAFNYGRGFAALELAIQQSMLPVTYIEPSKWTKEMCQGIDRELKPKARSLIAMQRLFPELLDVVPTNKNGKFHDGVIDAFLIAEYGRRTMKQ